MMSLYESLDQFVGAGLLACAPAVGCDVPASIAGKGRQLSVFLREQGEGGVVGALLDALAQDVWLAQDARGIEHKVSVDHAVILAGVLAAHRPLAQDVAAAIEKARSGFAGSANGMTPASRSIAGNVFVRARDAGAFEVAGVVPDVIMFLLDRLFAHLLDDPALLPSLAKPLAAFVATNATKEQAPFATRLKATLTQKTTPPAPVATSARPAAPAAAMPAQIGAVPRTTHHVQGTGHYMTASDGNAALAISQAPEAIPAPQATPEAVAPATKPATDITPAVAPQHLALFEARGEMPALDELRARYGLTTRALGLLIALLAAENVPPERLLGRLEDLAAWLKVTREALLKPSNDEADVRRLKARAAMLLADGDLEQAADVMKQIRRHVRDGRRKIEGRLEEEIAGLKTQMLEEAQATGRLAELAMARFDFDAASELFAEAADCVPQGDREGQWRFLMRQAEALSRKGNERRDTAALTEAARIYESAARLASSARNAVGEAVAQAGLANALFTLAQGDAKPERLREAIGCYRKALIAFPQAAESHRRAMTQVQLGNALQLLGERESDGSAYRDAVAAYRDALSALTRESTPLDWALAQLGLGNALIALEEKESSAELLEEAVAAYGQALKVLSRERNAIEWASLQLSLGNALHGLGEAEGLSGRIEDAVAAHREALKVFTRDADAKRWSQVKMHLGNALASLGARDAAATSRYQEAIQAYEESLEVLSRESTPLAWAITKMNLGSVLIRLGERQDKRNNWLAAASALMPALDVFERQGHPEYARLTRQSLLKFHEQWAHIFTQPGETG